MSMGQSEFERGWMAAMDEANQAAAEQKAKLAITTIDQLKACPRGSVVLDANQLPFRRWPAENGEDHWASGEIALPATLLWHPSWPT